METPAGITHSSKILLPKKPRKNQARRKNGKKRNRHKKTINKGKKQKYNNPFNELFFWLTIAITDFGLFQNLKQSESESDIHT